MREIKFRAWDQNKKIMSDVFCIDDIAEAYDCGFFARAYEFNGVDVAYCKNIMQFTGLKDKNGKEIYEGDIIGDKSGTKFEVKSGWTTDGVYGWVLYSHRNKKGYECDHSPKNATIPQRKCQSSGTFMRTQVFLTHRHHLSRTAYGD